MAELDYSTYDGNEMTLHVLVALRPGRCFVQLVLR